MEKVRLKDLTYAELEEYLLSIGLKNSEQDRFLNGFTKALKALMK